MRGGHAPSSVAGSLGVQAGGLDAERDEHDALRAGPQPYVRVFRIKPLAGAVRHRWRGFRTRKIPEAVRFAAGAQVIYIQPLLGDRGLGAPTLGV